MFENEDAPPEMDYGKGYVIISGICTGLCILHGLPCRRGGGGIENINI